MKQLLIAACWMMLFALDSGNAIADSFRLEKCPERMPTPDLRGGDVSAQPLDLSSLRGKVILLNY